MYGVNDVFDYESDLRNPRKGGIEGDVVRDREAARRIHRGILWASAITVLPPLAWLLTQGSTASSVSLLAVVAGCWRIPYRCCASRSARSWTRSRPRSTLRDRS